MVLYFPREMSSPLEWGTLVMEYSTQTRNDLLALRSDLLKQINELQNRIQAIDVILPNFPSSPKATLRVEITSSVADHQKGALQALTAAMNVSLIGLRGLKQLPALKAIARARNGIVRTLEAKDLMVKAGVVKDSKNAYKMVYNLIKTSDEFQPTENRGEYRLIETQPPLVQ